MERKHGQEEEKSIVMRHYRYAGRRLDTYHVGQVVVDRLLPLLSLTYIAAVLGLAFREKTASVESFVSVLTQQQWIYGVALLFTFWVSIPCILWLSIRSTIRFPHLARAWYWMTALCLFIVLLFGWILMQEAKGWINALAATVIPMHVICYILLCISPLPRLVAWPLLGMGVGLGTFGSFFI